MELQESRESGTPPAAPSPMASARAGAPYAQVKAYLKEGLAGGRWPPDALMPSEAQLVAQFGVSRMTVGRALRELVAEGLVRRVQGVGSFAAHLLRVASTLTIHDLHEEIGARAHRHHVKVHLCRSEPLPAAQAAQFGLSAGTPVFHTLIVHFENDIALQCEDRFVNPACAPDYLKTDFTRITPTQYLLQVAPLWQAQYSIEAGAPSAREARLLDIPRQAPCLIIVRRTVNHGVPITLARLTHPGSRYRLEGRFEP